MVNVHITYWPETGTFSPSLFGKLLIIIILFLKAFISDRSHCNTVYSLVVILIVSMVSHVISAVVLQSLSLSEIRGLFKPAVILVDGVLLRTRGEKRVLMLTSSCVSVFIINHLCGDPHGHPSPSGITLPNNGSPCYRCVCVLVYCKCVYMSIIWDGRPTDPQQSLHWPSDVFCTQNWKALSLSGKL